MTFAFASKCSNLQTFDFVNVMNSYIAIHNHLFAFVCCSHLNILVAGKHKYNPKTLRKKCQLLKDLKKRND